MLELLRRYQRYIFGVVTFVTIASFAFFGTYSTFDNQNVREDSVVGKTVKGEPIHLSKLQNLIRFLAKDREDLADGAPNFCNDGVLRYDFLRTQLADLIVTQYFSTFQADLSARLEKAKRFKPYIHPKDKNISVETLWTQFLPAMNRELKALQTSERVSPEVFQHLSRLYQQEGYLNPTTVRQFLAYQEQLQGLEKDPQLAQTDFSLFGFHSSTDWFGAPFLEKVAHFILHAASEAKAHGYHVSLDEARADLLHTFQESATRFKAKFSFADQLRFLGMDENTAAETWQNVLLFRRYFQDVGYATFVDRLPYTKFANYALESNIVDEYRFPFVFTTLNDLYKFQLYLDAVTPSTSWPATFYTLEEIEKTTPELVQTPYKVKLAQVTKTQVGLRIPLKEIWEWQLQDTNWERIVKEFPDLPDHFLLREDRFAALEKLTPAVRARVDSWSRAQLVSKNPSWIDAALEVAPKQELEVSVSAANIYLPGNIKLPAQPLFDGNRVSSGSSYYRLEDAEKLGEKQILPFEKARAVFSTPKDEVIRSALKDTLIAIDATEKHEWKPGTGPDNHYTSHRFAAVAKKAYEALQKNPEDPNWISTSTDPFLAQWKLQRTEKNVQRTSREEWMKNETPKMIPNQWSPLHVPMEGAISFFYLKERRPIQEPVLEQINFGYEILAADAQRVLARHLLEAIQQQEESYP